MDESWYYARDQRQFGPVPADSIKQLVQSGQIGPNDLLWHPGLPNWTPALKVLDANLFRSAPLPAQVEGSNPFAAPASDLAPGAFVTTPGHQFQYAGFWKRAFAIAIDGFLVGLMNFALLILAVIPAALLIPEPEGPFDQSTYELIVIAIAYPVSTIVFWLYFALMESSRHQATLGKRVLGIIVVDMYGNRIGFGRATGRTFGKIISYIICYIGFIIAAFTDRKQALHDLMASTLVITKRSRVTQNPFATHGIEGIDQEG